MARLSARRAQTEAGHLQVKSSGGGYLGSSDANRSLLRHFVVKSSSGVQFPSLDGVRGVAVLMVIAIIPGKAPELPDIVGIWGIS